MFATLSGWMLGLLFGMRHALEPDHLAAVSTLVTERRTGRDSVMLGAAWGLGHTFTLTVVGGALFLLRARVPERVEVAFELGVAAMLLVLGGRALVMAARASAHEHPGPVPHIHVGPLRLSRRPVLIGLVHGLAGTGALTAAVMAKFASASEGLVYIVLFGLGSTTGMALLTGALGVPLARVVRHPRAVPVLVAFSGAVSLVVAIGWGWSNLTKLLF